MSKSSRVDRVYARLLLDHAYGWGLFKKFTTRDIHPGVCGYFDSDGDWHTLVDLNDADDLASQGWSTLDVPMNRDDKVDLMTWGPKKSGSVVARRTGITAGTNIGVAPVEASVNIAFETGNEEGAILVAENPVQRNCSGDQATALRWMAANTTDMCRRYRSIVKQHGVWIVTKTYSARRCAVAVISSNSSAVELGLGATAPGIASLTPSSSWSNQTGSSCAEIHEDESGVVLFMSGVYFSEKPFRSKLKPTVEPTKQAKSIFRGGWDESEDLAQDDVPLELDACIFPGLPGDIELSEDDQIYYPDEDTC
ncbi:hypothetical protein ColLi_09346 [Colletotrichum liriopes]|uniref:Uncharacterized protein n=1 Tax=Colletotrichum liriopes TaxID=708192 RepID=A0AA37GSN0_9PEZI|nr:hypothetical protein ColLi_09346 [Colletotrichum liriopes]